MSFSSSVREELCKVPISRTCCARSEAYGALLFGHVFTHREIRLMTSNAAFAARLPKLFGKAFNLAFDDISIGEKNSGKTFLSLTDPAKIATIFSAFGYEAGSTLVHHVNLSVLESDCCRVSFIRGAFLSGGSVASPSGRCHLELVTDHRSVSRETYSLLLEMGFEPRDIQRGGRSVIYFKRSDAVEDLLTTMGADKSAMQLMAAKIEKELRNDVNRRVNCDSANADRIVSAAQAQLEQIRKLDRVIGIGNLPPDLQEVAMLRIANPEASLSDMAQLSESHMSKASVNYRLRKLMNYDLSGQGPAV